MSQSRFSIVLVGVSALLRRPLVSRLRPADGERLPWVAFTARRCLPFRLFGMRRFGVALGELVLLTSASEIAARRVGFRAHCSAFRHAPLRRLPLGGLAFGLTAPLFGMRRFGVAARWVGSSVFRFGVAAGRVRSSAFRFGNCPRRVGLRAHCFRFSARTTSELPFGGLVLPLGGLAFGLIASAFRHAPLRRLPSAGWFFRSASWSSDSLLPLFGTHRFGVAAGRVRSSAFRFGDCPRRVGLRAHRFRFSACADPHRRAAEARTDGAQRHDNCFTSKHLSQHVNLPHRTP